MTEFLKKKEAAQYMRVSLPTLRKFLKKHKDIMVDGKISAGALKNLMEKESMQNLPGKEKKK